MYRSQTDENNKQNVITSARKAIYTLLLAALFVAPLALGQARSFNFNGSLRVEVYTGGQLTDLPAMVVLSSEGSMAGIQQTVCNDGIASFSSVLPGNYAITVRIAGFKDGIAEAEVSGGASAQATVSLEPSDDSRTQDGAPGFMLAPKAKKNLDLGLAALQASQFEQAQEHLEAAYKMAPGDPNVSSALGELYLETKNFGEAEQYIEHATSVAPDDIYALVETGQLRILQDNPAAAQPALEHAINVAPRNKFAHWLLAIVYLDQGLYEKAKDEATQVVKINKSAATDGEFILGEALAGLGRTPEAIATLKTFVKKVPRDAYTPYAENLIAKLQSGSPDQTTPQGGEHNAALAEPTNTP